MKNKFYKSRREAFVSLHLLLVTKNLNEATGNLDFVSSLLKDSNKNELKSQRSLLFSSRGFLISFLFPPPFFVELIFSSFLRISFSFTHFRSSVLRNFCGCYGLTRTSSTFTFYFKKSSEAPRRVNVTATIQIIINW